MQDGKESKNNAMLKFVLNALKQMPVTLELLSGGGNIPKTVKKFAKKWPHEEVQKLAGELFEMYLKVLENNTAATPIQAGGDDNKRIVHTPPPMVETSEIEDESAEELVDDQSDDAGQMVEDWENEWTIYEAEDDETPAMIANKHKVSLKDLLQVNTWKKGFESMIGSSKLMEGTSIQIPTDGPNDPKNLTKHAPKKRPASVSDSSASAASNRKRFRSDSENSTRRSSSVSSGVPRSISNNDGASIKKVTVLSAAATVKPHSPKPTLLVKQPPKVQPAQPVRKPSLSGGRPGGFGAALGT